MTISSISISRHCIRVAYRSTQGEGRFAKKRWGEFALYFDPQAPDPSNRWIAQKIGRSIVPGEVDRITTFAARTHTLALAFLDNSAPVESVRFQAEEWLAENPDAGRLPTMAPGEKVTLSVPPAVANDDEAIRRLFGQGLDELNVRGAAKLLGVNESTMRKAISDGRPMRVGLIQLAPFVDVAAFRAHVQGLGDGPAE